MATILRLNDILVDQMTRRIFQTSPLDGYGDGYRVGYGCGYGCGDGHDDGGGYGYGDSGGGGRSLY